MKVKILGTDYTIRRVNRGQDEYLEKMSYGGYCDSTRHEIVLLNLKSVDDWKDESDEVIAENERRTLRHEIVHAFLNESGLQWSSSSPTAWAKNEEMVDWIALQFPKILKAFQSVGAI